MERWLRNYKLGRFSSERIVRFIEKSPRRPYIFSS
jgi:hypothetical protein